MRNNQVQLACVLLVVLCHALQDVAIACAMRAKAAHVVQLIQRIWQRIHIGSRWHCLVEGCVKDTHLQEPYTVMEPIFISSHLQ